MDFDEFFPPSDNPKKKSLLEEAAGEARDQSPSGISEKGLGRGGGRRQ